MCSSDLPDQRRDEALDEVSEIHDDRSRLAHGAIGVRGTGVTAAFLVYVHATNSGDQHRWVDAAK